MLSIIFACIIIIFIILIYGKSLNVWTAEFLVIGTITLGLIAFHNLKSGTFEASGGDDPICAEHFTSVWKPGGFKGKESENKVREIFNCLTGSDFIEISGPKNPLNWLYREERGRKIYLDLDGYCECRCGTETKKIAFEYRGGPHYRPGQADPGTYRKTIEKDKFKILKSLENDVHLIIIHIDIEPHLWPDYIASRLSDIGCLDPQYSLINLDTSKSRGVKYVPGSNIFHYIPKIPEPEPELEPEIKPLLNQKKTEKSHLQGRIYYLKSKDNIPEPSTGEYDAYGNYIPYDYSTRVSLPFSKYILSSKLLSSKLLSFKLLSYFLLINLIKRYLEIKN